MKINIISYGTKYHEYINCDILIYARSLKNPYYQEELKEYSGLDNRVSYFLWKDSYTKEYLESIMLMIDLYLENISTKLDEITIAVKCTGGMHRSVFIANYLYKELKDAYDVNIKHLDLID